MRRVVSVVVLALSAACADPSAPGGGSGASGGSAETLPAVVAEAGGVQVTAEEMQRGMAGQEYQLRQQLHRMRGEWLENELITKMLEKEATKQGLTSDQLLEKVDAGAKVATDEDAQMFYKTQLQAGRLKGPDGKTPKFEEVKDRIKSHLTEQSSGAVRNQFFSKLMEGSEVKLHLTPPDPPMIAAVSPDNDYVKGSENAKVTVVEFSDFQCPACRQAHFQLNGLLDKYGDKIKFVYRDFPLMGKHPDALPAAVAANCAGEQGKYWEMHDNLFKASKLKEEDFKTFASQLSLDGAKFASCLKDPAKSEEVMKDMADGREYGVNSTPTFYVNGYLVVGANVQEIGRLIDRELEKAGS